MFSIPSPVMEFDKNIEQLKEFEEVKDQKNVIFALSSQNPEVIS